MTTSYKTPMPAFAEANLSQAGTYYTIDYQMLLREAAQYREENNIRPRRKDKHLVGILGVDGQGTFGHKDGELSIFDGGTLENIRRVTRFGYEHLQIISDMKFSLDTHGLHMLPHPQFWLCADDTHPGVFTQISAADIRAGKYRVNPEMAYIVGGDAVLDQATRLVDPAKFQAVLAWLENYVLHYCEELERNGRDPLTIWNIHSQLGDPTLGIVSNVAECAKFHGLVRWAKPLIEIKAEEPLSERYSRFRNEVLQAHDGTAVGKIDAKALEDLTFYHVLIFWGWASSHCVRATIRDAMDFVEKNNPKLLDHFYILEDCIAPVPGFEKQANEALEEYRGRHAKVVSTEMPMHEWPDIPTEIFELV